jgi:hypothetical protein
VLDAHQNAADKWCADVAAPDSNLPDRAHRRRLHGSDAEKASTYYFPEAAAISSTYQAAAAAHFAGYRAALESATADTGDPIFVEASQGLFANLAADFDAAGAGLVGLTPPQDAIARDDAWLAAEQQSCDA